MESKQEKDHPDDEASQTTLANWNEKQAKEEKKVCCHDCRYFMFGCSEYTGKYHMPCTDFEWW